MPQPLLALQRSVAVVQLLYPMLLQAGHGLQQAAHLLHRLVQPVS